MSGEMQYAPEYWINRLKLIRHPEGGYYSESYKCARTVANRNSSESSGARRLASSIYFLLRDGEVSRLHRLRSDEVWYFHAGSPLSIFCIDQDGGFSVKQLGLDLDRGELPQLVIPAGTVFGAALEAGKYCLVGCMVTPGFEFEDFELLEREKLMEMYPGYKEIIFRLT